MSIFGSSEIDLGCDGHVHTRLCHHAVGEMEEYVAAALAGGLAELIFLEHFEIGINYGQVTWLTAEEFCFYQRQCRRLARKYAGRIRVGAGVEVGLNVDRLAETRDFLNSHSWARVGLSCHYFAEKGRHLNMLSRKPENIKALEALGHDRLLRRCYTDLLLGLQQLKVDVVCHLDAPLRYCQGVVFTAEHWRLIEAILAEMARQDIALEINTSGFAVRGEPFPCVAIIQRARRCGLRFVAGSDAHQPQDVGRFFHLLQDRG